MAQKLIRDIPDEVMGAIEIKAAEDKMNAEAWIRSQLISLVKQPVVKKCYAIRFYNDSDDTRGIIRRLDDDIRSTSATYNMVSQQAANIIRKCEDLVRRNAAGDREQVFALLRSCFENVFEVPV
jgi:hypothetical protein